MPYKISITGDAEHDVRNLPGNVRQRAVISALAEDPRPAGAKELRGNPGYCRLWLDRWRVIYRIYDDDQIVLVLRGGARRVGRARLGTIHPDAPAGTSHRYPTRAASPVETGRWPVSRRPAASGHRPPRHHPT